MSVFRNHLLIVSLLLLGSYNCYSQKAVSINSCLVDSVLVEYFLDLLEPDGFKELWLAEDSIVFTCPKVVGEPKIKKRTSGERLNKKRGQYFIKRSSSSYIHQDNCIGLSITLELQKRLTKKLWELQGYFRFNICQVRDRLIIKKTNGITDTVLFEGNR